MTMSQVRSRAIDTPPDRETKGLRAYYERTLGRGAKRRLLLAASQQPSN